VKQKGQWEAEIKGGETYTHVPEGFDSRFDWSTRWSISALLSVHPGLDRNVFAAIIKRFVGKKTPFNYSTGSLQKSN
jgi:hypothetical protein